MGNKEKESEGINPSTEIDHLRQRVRELERTEEFRKKAQAITKEVIQNASREKGKKVFHSLVQQLARILHADYLMIAELIEGKKQLHTLSFVDKNKISKNFTYELGGSPCEQAIHNGLCYYRPEVYKLFPNDQVLNALKVEGYVGIPLFDFQYRPIGIMAALYKTPPDDETLGLATAVFECAALLAAVAIKRRQLELKAKRQNKKLRVSDYRYRTLFNKMLDGYVIEQVIFDEQGNPVDFRYLEVNPAFETLTGLSRAQVIGKTMKEVLPGIEDYWMQMYGKVVLTGEAARYENYSSPLNKWYQVMAFKLSKTRVAAIFSDSTEQKIAEEKLSHLRVLLSNIINSMPSVLIAVDADGKVLEWNKEAEKKTGISTDDAKGKRLTDILPQFTSEMEKVKMTIETQEPQKLERIPKKMNGKMQYSDLTIYPLLHDSVEGAVIQIDDVTDRVRMEEMIIQSEKMISIGGLAAGMAHEINNPLAGILQNIQVIINRINPELSKNRQAARESGITMESVSDYLNRRGIISMLEEALESGLRAAKIVDNVLAFSRKSDSEFEFHDIRTLLDQTLEFASGDYDLKKRYDFRRIEIFRQYGDDVPDVLCDGTKIQQVFLNLLKNGAYAITERIQMEEKEGKTGEKARLTLRVRYEKETDRVRVEVEDNGIGMTEEIRKRVSEPFFTTKKRGIGTGLGLSISYSIIIQGHGGTMNVESTPGKGTKFIIRLPVRLEIKKR
ncbi:MAG: ATP-binding protein [Candidatus Omnitrophota bacterium]